MLRSASTQYAAPPSAYRNPSDAFPLPHRHATHISDAELAGGYAQSLHCYHSFAPHPTMPATAAAITAHYRSMSSSHNPVPVFLYDSSRSSSKTNGFLPVPYRGTPKYNTRRRLGSQILRRRSLSQSSMCSAQSQGYQTPQLMRHSVSFRWLLAGHRNIPSDRPRSLHYVSSGGASTGG